MRDSFSRRAFLTTALTSLASQGFAGAPILSLRPPSRNAATPDSSSRKLPESLSLPGELIEKARLSGQVSFAVSDTRTGQLLEQSETTGGLPPASVAKVMSALYALEALGANHRFETRLIATGPIRNGVLEGDLVLAGGGDPTLDTNSLALMATALKKSGVKDVRGSFRTWGGLIPYRRAIDETQPEHAGYNPSLSGLNLNFNRVHFEWRRAGGDYKVTMDARSDKYRPDVTMARVSLADRSLPVYSYRDAGERDEWSVARAALGKGGARWLPVRKPEIYAMEVFAALARMQGISLGATGVQTSAPSGEIILRHQSEPLTVILRDMLRHSTNITAEMVGMAASAKRRGTRVTLEQSAQDMTDWARGSLGMNGVRLMDHSGLNHLSRMTAGALAGALTLVHKDRLLQPLLREIDMRDERTQRTPAHTGKVVAKTGTLYFVSALAGYATTRGGKDLAFAVLTASDNLRAGIDPAQDESPPGAKDWNRRAKHLQRALIGRWSTLYDS